MIEVRGMVLSSQSRLQDDKDDVSPRVLGFGTEVFHFLIFANLGLEPLYLTENRCLP